MPDTAPPPLRPRGPARSRRRWTYALIGLALSLGAPLGLLLVRLAQARVTTTEGALSELAGDAWLYVYVTLSTAAVLAIFGWVLGQAHDRLHALALTDPLTGLPNRRLLSLLLDHDLARAARRGNALSLLLVDVDKLKEINEQGGHQSGDKALRTVADALRHACRHSDLPARIGGDEFAVLATDARREDAAMLAERIRRQLRDPRVSIGVATIEGNGDPRKLYADADAALYAAKAAGRDRVVEAPV